MAAILLLSIVSCSFPSKSELNLAFRLDRNQLALQSLEVDGHHGRFVLGTAAPQTIIDAQFAERHAIDDGDVHLRLRDDVGRRLQVGLADLDGEIDAIVGRDLLSPVSVIDYRRGLVTRLAQWPEVEVAPYSWRRVPSYPIRINGNQHVAVLDTAVPDTLLVPRSVLPGLDCTRCRVDVEIAGVSFDDLDVLVADVDQMRIGNRILEHFLLMIDYRRQRAALIH